MRATRDFARVERQGVRANGQWLAVTVRPGPGRLGLVVSKKVDNRAHQRNLLKRRLREVFRADKARWALRQRPSAPGTGGTGGGSVDVVVAVRPEAKGRSFAELQHDAWQTLDQAIAKLSSVKRPKPPHGGPGR